MATISAVTHYFFVSKAVKSVFILCLASTDYLKLCTHNLSLVASWGHSPKTLVELRPNPSEFIRNGTSLRTCESRCRSLS